MNVNKLIIHFQLLLLWMTLLSLPERQGMITQMMKFYVVGEKLKVKKIGERQGRRWQANNLLDSKAASKILTCSVNSFTLMCKKIRVKKFLVA